MTKWINKVSDTTRLNYLRAFWHFLEFVNKRGGISWTDENGEKHNAKTPTGLLKAQEILQGQGLKERYKILDVLQEWISSQKFRYKTLKRKYHAVRSFFNHNRVSLPEDKSWTPTPDMIPTAGKLTIEDFRKIILSSNELYQAIMLMQFQGFMGGAEIMHVSHNSWSQIKKQLDKDEKFIRIDLPGRKHARFKRPYYTFIGTDAIEALKRYLAIRGPIKNGEPIFINKFGDPVNKAAYQTYFRRRILLGGIVDYQTPECPECGGETRKNIVGPTNKYAKNQKSRTVYICAECGHTFPTSNKIYKELIRNRYGMSPHELRDLARSAWETSPAKGIVAEFFMGHSIDPNNYNKFFKTDPDWVKSQYRRANPWLNIMSEDPRKIPVTELERLTEKTVQQNGKIDYLEDENRKLEEKLLELSARMLEMKSQQNNIDEIVEEKVADILSKYMKKQNQHLYTDEPEEEQKIKRVYVMEKQKEFHEPITKDEYEPIELTENEIKEALRIAKEQKNKKNRTIQ